MKIMNDGKIDPEVADTLSEIGNVGVGQASIVLGKLLETAISIGIPRVASVESDINEIINDDPEKVAVGILMSLEKTLGGAVLFVVDGDFLSSMVKKLIGRELHGEELVGDRESLSAISEVANIMAAAYMKAVGRYTGIKIFMSPVMVGVDMIGALISYPAALLGADSPGAVCIDTSFAVRGKEKTETAGRMIMLPNENSVGRIIRALKKFE